MNHQTWFRPAVLLVAAFICSGCCGLPGLVARKEVAPSATAVPRPTDRPTTVSAPAPTATAHPSPTPGRSATSTVAPPPKPTPGGSVDLAEQFRDPQGFFTIGHPAQWAIRTSSSEVRFRGGRDGEIMLAVSIVIKSLSAEQLVEDITARQEEQWTDYAESRVEEIELAGYPALWVDRTWTGEGVAQAGFIAGLVRNRVGLLLQSWAPAANYAEYEGTLRAMVQSLQVNDFPEAPPYERWATHLSPHVVFRYLPDTWVATEIATIAAEHEQAVAGILRALETELDEPVTMYLYPSEASLQRATARDSGFAISEAAEVHSLWISPQNHQSLGHELTHVIAYQEMGDAGEALLGEGLAVCLDHSGRDHHSVAAALMAQEKLVPLAGMLGDDWFRQESAVAYAQSGSFACFLLEKVGIDVFMSLYPSKDLAQDLDVLAGASLELLEGEWLQMLRDHP